MTNLVRRTLAMNFTFVAQNHNSNRLRHARSRNACDSCRQKKKRCYHQRTLLTKKARSPPRPHATGGDSTGSPFYEADIPSMTTGSEPADAVDCSENGRPGLGKGPRQEQGQYLEYQQQASSSQNVDLQTDQQHPLPFPSPRSPPCPPSPRFVGDLNPEARLIEEAISSESSEDMTTGETGVWIQPRSCSKCSNIDDIDASSTLYTQFQYASPRCQGSSASDLLPQKTVDILSDLFFDNIHPIIPLLDEEEYRRNLPLCDIPMPLVHAVCLVAAKDKDAGAHLKLLQSGDTVVSVRQFCTQLHVSIMTDLARRPAIRKVTLIRILGLLSLHHEGIEGAEQASGCLAQAVHHAQTMGLQLQHPRGRNNGSNLKRTFWCLWTLDRLNAAIHSRPCCMADFDIAIDHLKPDESGSVAFDVWLKIAKLLNQVIGLYRPRSQSAIPELDSGFPGFEGIMDETHAWHLSRSTVATLHIFYLATAILAHRLKTITALPSPTAARLRQQLSAIQIIRNMQGMERLNALHPLPIVVYAPSLALSVSYQHLRYSRLLSDQEDARHDFNAGCNILQELRKKWEAADPIASLAHRISIALDKLPSLEVLRVGRPETMGREDKQNDLDGSGYISKAEGDWRSSADVRLENHYPAALRMLSEPQAIELFGGMDDVSWMYLDAHNPVSLESFPLMNYITG